MRSPGVRVLQWGIKPALHLALVTPAVLLVLAFVNRALGANPVEVLTHETGEWGLRILLLSLMVTPLARVTKSGWLIQIRRLIGLYAFFYALTHFAIYMLFDLSLDLGYLIEDIIERPYITVGFAAFVILLGLALTSPMFVRRKMGLAWAKFHRLVYVAGLLTVLHFLWITRADDTEPFIYGAIFIVLMGYRWLRKMPWRNTATAG